jgi:RNA polymerase sigma-70 factor (ECF subfamily)
LARPHLVAPPTVGPTAGNQSTEGASVPGEEPDLAAAISAGDLEAEAELCRRFQARIRRKVEAALPGNPDCEDLTSEILQGAIATLRKGAFRGDCRLSTFLHAVARNKIAEYLRRRRPETRRLTEEIPDSCASPEDDALREEVGRAVRDALTRLKPKYRDVLYLYYYRGLTVAQIAKQLGIPARRVSERKDYALKVIRSRFGTSLERFR